jgi:hypothetical protein
MKTPTLTRLAGPGSPTVPARSKCPTAVAVEILILAVELDANGEPAWVLNWRCTTGFALGRVNVTTETFEQFTIPFRSQKIESLAVAMVYSPLEAATYLI